MKYFLPVVILLFSFGLNIQSQTVEEADKLLAGKKYLEAADMYYKLYYFKKAVQVYQLQIDALIKTKKTLEADSIRPLQKQAEKLARMLSNCEDIQIIDSVVTGKNNFLETYFLGEEAGTIGQRNNTVVYENQLNDRRYFGKTDENGLIRLHSQTKIQDRWTEEKPLNLPSDSAASDNFPFVMPDGLTIYYASTGNGSIGGYDLFVSRYNLSNDTYLSPNQLSMPFNSIFNDYMLVIDEVNGIGYFATDRFQMEDSVVIYTFIPNSVFKPLNTDDEQILRERAQITSIRDTWLPNVNYQSRLGKIRSDIEKGRIKVIKDFTFVINDNIVYHSLTDFESDAAKKSYLQSKELEEKIQNAENQLDTQRQMFASGNREQKQSLRVPILTNERQLETMYQTHKKLLVEARNSEIKYLRTKN